VGGGVTSTSADPATSLTDDLVLPTRDGCGLATSIWRAGPDPGPVVVIRTPYGRKEQAPEAENLLRHGFHVVVQDVRGSGESEGEASSYFAEADDGADLADWIDRQDWFNGHLAAIGSSYLGFTALALAAASPITPSALVIRIYSSDRRSSWYPGGALNLDLALPWSISRARNMSGREIDELLAIRPDWLTTAYRHVPLEETDLVHGGVRVPMFQEWLTYPRDDAYWDPLDYSDWFSAAEVPTLLLGGWHDYHLPYMLEDFERRRALPVATELVVGPWTHSTLDEPLVQRITAAWLRDATTADGDHAPSVSSVRYRTQPDAGWRSSEGWPPAKRYDLCLYLAGSAALVRNVPRSRTSWTYSYDPADPTPAVGGPSLAPPPHGGSVDNSAREQRDDVLVFTAHPATSDTVVCGAEVELFVQIDNPHVDFLVRICDVDQQNVSRNVTDGFIRITPTTVPGWADSVVNVRITLNPTAYLLHTGHRLRLQVSSGDHPLHARNPGTGEHLASAIDMRRTRVTIVSSEQIASSLRLLVADELGPEDPDFPTMHARAADSPLERLAKCSAEGQTTRPAATVPGEET
jgi:putative CocE/NonD family hydrolase